MTMREGCERWDWVMRQSSLSAGFEALPG
jgi:hypothetical protein